LIPACGVRGTAIEGVLLTGGDLDEVLGLLALREGPRLAVHATCAVRRSLEEGLALDLVLKSYAGIQWRDLPERLAPLCDRDGRPSGLCYTALALTGVPPRYLRGRGLPSSGDRVGYLIIDESTGGRVVIAPGVAELRAATLARLGDCDLLLLDGTFWSENELAGLGCGKLRATEMGHVPIGDAGGSLSAVGPIAVDRKIYVHINNTNPILNESSPERMAVEAAGMAVGVDGWEFEL
jgi:pyrroloquinoline quinone biosynthesis protein B